MCENNMLRLVTIHPPTFKVPLHLFHAHSSARPFPNIVPSVEVGRPARRVSEVATDRIDRANSPAHAVDGPNESSLLKKHYAWFLETFDGYTISSARTRYGISTCTTLVACAQIWTSVHSPVHTARASCDSGRRRIDATAILRATRASQMPSWHPALFCLLGSASSKTWQPFSSARPCTTPVRSAASSIFNKRAPRQSFCPHLVLPVGLADGGSRHLLTLESNISN